MKDFIGKVINNMPNDWLKLTTHRLDIYNESLAKTEFIDAFDSLFKKQDVSPTSLNALPTAYDYIRLGHPLSSVLEWTIAKMYDLPTSQVITFSSSVMPLMAVLRTNLLLNRKTLVAHNGPLPKHFDQKMVRAIYGYNFDLVDVSGPDEIPDFEGSVVYFDYSDSLMDIQLAHTIDFFINVHSSLGSVVVINGQENHEYVGEIQHVRRRESIAMTPSNCLQALKQMVQGERIDVPVNNPSNLASLQQTIKTITGAQTEPVVGSSGLSIQYAITMGLIDDALENHPGHDIKLVIPPNCYGGTNDQARRVAACLPQVEVVDLPVDGDHDMVQSIDKVLDQMAKDNAIPLIIVEIPTNPRVEVPNLDQLKEVLNKSRKTASGEDAIDPVFILDQTFCPNVQFLGDEDMLSDVRTISYVSGSKFPSGGLCTAGYCQANRKAEDFMAKIDRHIKLCDNEATSQQISILDQQMPSMLQRIQAAYSNTRAFVEFIGEKLPEAKINFVSKDLAARGFTPSVFSLDLPTKGEDHEEREAYKRTLNHRLIHMMITEIPDESKYCVSYGQLKGCYWTIPATSTQGTTKEADKDYIARVACSPNMDLERHKAVFASFVDTL